MASTIQSVMSLVFSSRVSDGSSWVMVERHISWNEFQLRVFRFTLGVPRSSWSTLSLTLICMMLWTLPRLLLRTFQVFWVSQFGEASEMSMGYMLSFVARCVSSPVFKTTRFRVNVKSSIILPLRSECRAPNIGEWAFPQMMASWWLRIFSSSSLS